MNKKEISEIKRNFNDESGFFTLNKVVSAFVDSEKNIKYKNTRAYNTIEENEAELIMGALRKVFSGTVSKNLLEYRFPDEQYAEGGTQNILYKAVKSKFEDEQSIEVLLKQVVEKMVYASTYAIFAGYCSYSVFKKSSDGGDYEDSDSNYNFIVVAVCPVEIRIDGLIYDEDANEIIKKPNTDRMVSESPTDGFIYPVFSDRGSDVNHVMYYTKKPKEPNTTVVNDVLGCEFIATAYDEKATFQCVLNNVIADELNYDIITTVNEKILEVVEENKDETEPPVIDKQCLNKILTESGVSVTKLEVLDKVFESVVGDTPLRASNLVEKKTVLSMPSITINITKDGVNKVKTTVIEGKKCLVIDLDDPEISVNGLTASVTARTGISASQSDSDGESTSTNDSVSTNIGAIISDSDNEIKSIVDNVKNIISGSVGVADVYSE